MSPTPKTKRPRRRDLWLDQLAGAPLMWLVVSEVLVLAAVNALDFPLSVPYLRRATGQTYLDFCAFCSGAEVSRQLSALGPRGRALQLLLLPSIDVVIPVLSGLSGVAVLRRTTRALGPRWGWLLVLPLAATCLDFCENAVIARVVSAYPEPLPVASAWLGAISGAKFTAYAATVICAVITALSGLRTRTEPRPGPRRRHLSRSRNVGHAAHGQDQRLE